MTADKDKVFRPLTTNVDVMAGFLNARNILITELLPPLKKSKRTGSNPMGRRFESLVYSISTKTNWYESQNLLQWPWSRRLREMMYSAKKKNPNFPYQAIFGRIPLLGPICLFMITNAIS